MDVHTTFGFLIYGLANGNPNLCTTISFCPGLTNKNELLNMFSTFYLYSSFVPG
jgi:hypothetical protein